MVNGKRSASKQQQAPGSLQRPGPGRHRKQRGATIVEFAMGFTVFLVVIFTLVEFGRLMWTYSTLAHVTRQAGRFCVVRGSENPVTTTDLQTVINRHANSSGLDSSLIGVTTKWNDDPTPASIERGDFVEVRLSYPFRFVTAPIVVAGNSLQLSSTCRMVVAN